MKHRNLACLRLIVVLLAVAMPLRLAGAQIPTDSFTPTLATNLLQQGETAYRAGQLEVAVQAFKQARQAFQQQKDSQGEGMALSNLGAAYLSLERYRDAATVLEAYLPIAQALKNEVGEAQALGNLGIAYKNLGIYSRSIEVQRQAGKLLLKLGDRSGVGQVLLNLGNVFEVVGDYDKAMVAYQQSLKIARQVGNQLGEGSALNNLGQIYANQANYREAIQTTQQSLAISRQAKDQSGQASALINLGAIYHAQNLQQTAAVNYREALAIARQIQNRRLEAQALGSLGLVDADRKDFVKAIEALQQSLAIARQLGDPQLTGMTLNNLGHTFFVAGQLGAAEATLREALRLLDALRPELTDKYNVSLFDTQIHSYNLLQQILIAANQPEAALEATEHGRARAFVELLANRVQGSQPSAITKPASQPLNIQQIKQIAKVQNATLVEYAIVPDDDFTFRGKQKARESELLIWVVSPAGNVTFRQVDLKPLWQKELTLAKVVTLARCFNPGGICPQLAAAVRGIGVIGKPEVPLPKPLAVNLIGLKKLHELLIAPIATALPTEPTDRVIFIPQDSLFLVPFAALQAADESYLIEHHTILTAPAIQVLALTREQRTQRQKQFSATTNTTLVVGNPTMPSVVLQPGQPAVPLPPLPGAEQEAIAVAKLLKTEALIGAKATKAAVLQKLPQANRVHLATHGLLEYGGSSSLQGLGVPGAIALAASGQDNGLLTASEMMDLRLQADLVVLSACDTGQGRITGDGVIGLSRSLISAGVPSVIVSLWSVPDAPTARLMVDFYRNLQTQPDIAKALRQAMLATMKDYPRPVDWAAFNLIGEAVP